MFNVTKAWVVLNCSELSPNIFRKRRNVSCAHYDFFPEQLLLSYVRFPFQINPIFFFFFAPKNCFQTLLTNPISDLEMFFKNAVVDKFWFLGKIVLTETVRCSWTNLEKCLQDFFCQLFFSLFLFCFVLSRFCWFFTFPRHRKKTFFVALTVDQKPKLKLKLKPPTIGTKIFFCVRNRKTNEEKEAAKEEKNACECVRVCACVCVTACVRGLKRGRQRGTSVKQRKWREECVWEQGKANETESMDVWEREKMCVRLRLSVGVGEWESVWMRVREKESEVRVRWRLVRQLLLRQLLRSKGWKRFIKNKKNPDFSIVQDF